jgi:hypothetical protein
VFWVPRCSSSLPLVLKMALIFVLFRFHPVQRRHFIVVPDLAILCSRFVVHQPLWALFKGGDSLQRL